MKSKWVASGLALVSGWSLTIALGFAGVGTIGFPQVVVVQQQTDEIDAAIDEGMRLFKEESANSLREAIGYFEKASGLARSAKFQDKQALSPLVLGRIYDSLGEKQKAIDYLNQASLIRRAFDERSIKPTVSKVK